MPRLLCSPSLSRGFPAARCNTADSLSITGFLLSSAWAVYPQASPTLSVGDETLPRPTSLLGPERCGAPTRLRLATHLSCHNNNLTIGYLSRRIRGHPVGLSAQVISTAIDKLVRKAPSTWLKQVCEQYTEPAVSMAQYGKGCTLSQQAL